MRATATARPRVGLLGNPGDVLGGPALAFTFDDFAARATVEPAERFILDAGPEPLRGVADWSAFVSGLMPRALLETAPDLALLAATVRSFAAGRPAARPAPFALRVESDFPRHVGFGASSATAVAALRALAAACAIELEPIALAALALRAETDELGRAASPQDRVAQALEGLVLMRFGSPLEDGRYERLDASLLPPLFVAWRNVSSASTAAPHAALRERAVRGDVRVRMAAAQLAGFVDFGVAALRSHAAEALRALVTQSFETRIDVTDVDDADHAMVALGRAHGAATKLAGARGAVVGIPRSADQLDALERAFRAAGHGFLRPRVTVRS